MIIENGNISHDCKLGVFTVLGTTGNPQAVRLFPKETCTCPSASLCYHIMAVRMSIGMDQQKPLSKVNLSRLRRNARSKKDKTSGRKNQGLVIMMLSLLQIPSPVKNSATVYVECYS